MIWQQYFTAPDERPFSFHTVEETSDGGFIFVGKILNATFDDMNILVLKLDADGEIVSSASDLVTVSCALIYPTLVSTDVHIDCATCTDSRVFLTDLNGKLLQSQKLNADKTTLSLSDLAAGIYFVSLEQNGRIFQTRKVVKK